MSRLKEIHDYLVSIGNQEEELLQLDESSVYLCMEIMEYAHRNQKRENGEEYANHPTRCMNLYRNLVGIIPDDPFCIDVDLMHKYGIPYEGVQEVCLLHDVIEDTDFTMDELEEIFDECMLGDYFRINIKDALSKITHDKSVDYPSYIAICMENPVSAICKMMDLQDNTNLLTLAKLDKDNYKRTVDYIGYMFVINRSYQFIENADAYRQSFSK